MISLYVGNLPFSTTEDELKGLFQQHGQVQRASVVIDRNTGRSRGFGFVDMANDAEGHAAIAALNGLEFSGRTLVVNEARPREHAGGRAGGFGGNRGGHAGGAGGGGGGGNAGGNRGDW